jgi:uncharacterized membrane protein YeaQ/YmgE (transglycosylase-associated protein family)
VGILTAILSAIVVGLIVGALARLIVPGTKGMSIIATVLLGIAGAVVGTFVYRLFGGTDTAGIDWIRLLIQVVAAAIFVAIYAGATAGKRNSST